MQQTHRIACPICKKLRLKSTFMNVSSLHPSIKKIMADKNLGSDSEEVCLFCIQDFRRSYIYELLKREKSSLGELEAEVAKSLKAGESISENVNELAKERLTYGQVLADNIARFGGSWTFIITFAVCLGAWILISYLQKEHSFDPYPFILLNLILSCLAALQAPIIMMSQNRQEAKDRIRGEHDYQVNLKAELEIRELHLKLDRLMTNHWESLLEIQQAQIEILNEQTRILLEEKKK